MRMHSRCHRLYAVVMCKTNKPFAETFILQVTTILYSKSMRFFVKARFKTSRKYYIKRADQRGIKFLKIFIHHNMVAEQNKK